jgi:hypothetical protein
MDAAHKHFSAGHAISSVVSSIYLKSKFTLFVCLLRSLENAWNSNWTTYF